MAPRSRIKVFEANEIAKDIAETFKDRPVEREERLGFDWPDKLQMVGESLGVAYDSDKWKPRGADGVRRSELYKHIAESPNRIYADPSLIKLEGVGGKGGRTIGPRISLKQMSKRGELVMPEHFAILGRFMECNCVLHVAGTDNEPVSSEKSDDGCVTLTVRHGMLGASKFRRGNKYQPFLFVYHPTDGVYFLITGDELDIEKDGIVG